MPNFESGADVIESIFQKVYNSNVPPEVDMEKMAEVLEGTQANGLRVILRRPILDVETELEEPGFFATIEYPTEELLSDAPVVLSRRFFIANMEIYEQTFLDVVDDNTQEPVSVARLLGSGEKSDLLSILCSSTFS